MSMPLNEMPKRVIIEVDDASGFPAGSTIHIEDEMSGVTEEWVVISTDYSKNVLDILFSCIVYPTDI